MRPNFIIGGTVTAGTSFLSVVLMEHPDIYLPKPMRPECNFFIKSGEYAKGLEYYENRYFSGVSGQRAVGERSSLYLSDFRDGVVAERIRRELPKVKFIFMLRDPVDRAYANYRFTCLSGLEWLSFEKAIEREEKRMASMKGSWQDIQPYAYFSRGLYARQLKPFFSRFERDQLLVLNSDIVRKNPREEVSRVLKFLGVSEMKELPEASVFTSPGVRSLTLQRFLRWLEPLELDESVERSRIAEKRGLRDYVVHGNLKMKPDPMREETRNALKKRYSEAYAELAQFVEWPADVWS